LLKNALSSNLFNDFKSSYQTYPNQTLKPFVYIDTLGNVKLLTDVVADDGERNGVFAVSVAQDGWMEFLALEE